MSPRNHQKPCLTCYQSGHTKCTRNSIRACSSCFRLNVLSKRCNCNHPKRRNPPQLLRIVGSRFCHQWYLDVEISDTIIPALVNPSIKRSRVNNTLATWWQSTQRDSVYHDTDTIIIKTRRQGNTMEIPCDVVYAQNEFIQLGMEFLIAIGYTFTLEGVSISSHHSPILSSPYETDYIYNHSPLGDDLRQYLNQKRFFLKRSRIINVNLNSSNLTVTIRRSSQ